MHHFLQGRALPLGIFTKPSTKLYREPGWYSRIVCGTAAKWHERNDGLHGQGEFRVRGCVSLIVI